MSQSNFDWSKSYLHPAPWNMDFPPLALHDMFFSSAAREAAHPMLDFMGRKYSYSEMAMQVRRIAKALQDRGIDLFVEAFDGATRIVEEKRVRLLTEGS